jgi:hypothetical protein
MKDFHFIQSGSINHGEKSKKPGISQTKNPRDGMKKPAYF